MGYYVWTSEHHLSINLERKQARGIGELRGITAAVPQTRYGYVIHHRYARHLPCLYGDVNSPMPIIYRFIGVVRQRSKSPDSDAKESSISCFAMIPNTATQYIVLHQPRNSQDQVSTNQVARSRCRVWVKRRKMAWQPCLNNKTRTLGRGYLAMLVVMGFRHLGTIIYSVATQG
ncbi:uncharacterized protein F4807DRAFT_418312 [Annulohypoxylon truncatum]|uniref:uncharacterized protein n=1 Tax=Annulohypoxylon truncatum TaxID=327061 RepID=UPI00200873CE|nr:uncharacterized protein F4807DRAFT_418312 [Annulohypoxylon truncatum]KAI1211582.1 hypothetical protein F4807DRAFT_418312 [Annulohypoxylon truncatum]